MPEDIEVLPFCGTTENRACAVSREEAGPAEVNLSTKWSEASAEWR